MKRLLGVQTVLFVLGLSLGPSAVLTAADYPIKPVTLLIPMAPGGSSDVLGRAFASVANKYLEQPVVAVNKSGASMPLPVFLDSAT
jgi:tripartite-type tricarboxylate transporter receptor subunit TctC